MYVREEYDPLWLEVRRYLSIRSAKYPRAMKNEQGCALPIGRYRCRLTVDLERR
jgi:hypothetical protein